MYLAISNYFEKCDDDYINEELKNYYCDSYLNAKMFKIFEDAKLYLFGKLTKIVSSEDDIKDDDDVIVAIDFDITESSYFYETEYEYCCGDIIKLDYEINGDKTYAVLDSSSENYGESGSYHQTANIVAMLNTKEEAEKYRNEYFKEKCFEVLKSNFDFSDDEIEKIYNGACVVSYDQYEAMVDNNEDVSDVINSGNKYSVEVGEYANMFSITIECNSYTNYSLGSYDSVSTNISHNLEIVEYEIK